VTMRTRPGQVKWTGCSGGSACPFGLHQFDPKMEKFQTWAIPDGGDIVRNMDVDRSWKGLAYRNFDQGSR
jgi:hypothetical protein